MTDTTLDEDVARMVMARVLGVPVEQHDDCSRPRMHDFRFTLPDGRSGAAEMTSVTDPADREWLAAARFPRHVPYTTCAFLVRRMGQPVTSRQVSRPWFT